MDTTLNKVQVSATGMNDQHAFEAIYRQYFIRLFRFCYAIVHEKGAAEEIANDVFLNIWKKRESLAAIDNFEVYLYISAKNHCLNHLRRHRHQQAIDVDGLCEDALQFQADPESLLIRAETMRRLIPKASSSAPKR